MKRIFSTSSYELFSSVQKNEEHGHFVFDCVFDDNGVCKHSCVAREDRKEVSGVLPSNQWERRD